MYHHIEVNPRPNDPLFAALFVAPDKLGEQLKYLSAHNFHTITFDDIDNALNGRILLPANPILITFDDGWRSFYSKAFPLLRKYGMKATSFIITNYPDQKHPEYLHWEQIAEMAASGLIDFEAHTKSHPYLTRYTGVSLADELRRSKDDLELHLKKPVHWFAYPYGDYNSSVVKAVEDAGFFGAVTTDYGTVETLNGIYLMPRIMVDGRFTLAEFERRITSGK
jgi:peptidoglycan/xylan/chitin deacetylase (PgdA/CDA1 family)